MSITLAQIASNTARADFEFSGEPVHIDYRPAMLTERVIQDLRAVEKPTDGSDPDPEKVGHALNSLLITLVATWDVLSEDGSVYPLDPDHLSALPYLFRAECIKAIFQDIGLGEQKGTTSPQPSAATS